MKAEDEEEKPGGGDDDEMTATGRLAGLKRAFHEMRVPEDDGEEDYSRAGGIPRFVAMVMELKDRENPKIYRLGHFALSTKAAAQYCKSKHARLSLPGNFWGFCYQDEETMQLKYEAPNDPGVKFDYLMYGCSGALPSDWHDKQEHTSSFG